MMNDRSDLVDGERFAQDEIHAICFRVLRSQAVQVACHEGDGGARPALLEAVCHLESGDAGKADVHDDQVELPCLELDETGLAILAAHDRVTVSVEELTEHLAHLARVVHYQDLRSRRDLRHGCGRGGYGRGGSDLRRTGGAGQANRERAALAERALNHDLAAVSVHDGTRSAQAEVPAFLPLRGEEGIEDAEAHLV